LRALEDYHLAAADDARHFAVFEDIATRFWQAQHGRAIIAANLDLFRRLLGPDLHVQQYPYLRIVRPRQADDAVPLHRDIYYGASPYEVSVVVPFTDMGPDCTVRAVPGSHVEPDAAYPYVQQESMAVTLGSPRHKLGYAYAPRLLDPALAARTEPMPAKVGQALIFGLSLVHGGGANHGDRTRFSTDIRVVSSLAPVQLDRGVRKDYFVPLCSSPISRSAERYRARNGGLRPAEPTR
jgi:ectoine hydroxylase-related dioxygenase (phytanoyl-CoA dioxygenase family)